MSLKQPDSFHERRAKGVGGSEIAIIMDASPYRSRYNLWLEKTKREIPKDISNLPHVVRGVLGEQSCRLLLERKLLKAIRPKSWQGGKEWHLCTDDGYIHELNQIIEIKCMGKVNHEGAARGEIPYHYLLQCQWNLFVSRAEKCLFVSFKPEDETMHVIEVLPDMRLQAECVRAADFFWLENVKKDVPPPVGPKDWTDIADPQLDLLMEEYARTYEPVRKAELKNALAVFVQDKRAVRCSRGTILRYKHSGEDRIKITPIVAVLEH